MAGTTQRYYFQIADLAAARGSDPELALQGSTPQAVAAELGAALRQPLLWQRWKAKQAEPDEVDPALGAVDPAASVSARGETSRTDIEVVTKLSHAVLKHRLGLLLGPHWTMSDVKAL